MPKNTLCGTNLNEKKERKMTTKTEANMWEQQEVVRLLKGAPGTQYQEADETNRTKLS